MMRPQVRGGTDMLSCFNAANPGYSPRSRFSSCFLRISLRVGGSTPGLLLLAPRFVSETRDPFLDPPFQDGVGRRGDTSRKRAIVEILQPCAWRWITVRRRSSGSVISSEREECRVARRGRGHWLRPLARCVCWLGIPGTGARTYWQSGPG